MAMDWVQVILCAGRSSRMGFPKGLARLKGQPILAHQVKAGYEAGADRVVVVLGFHEVRYRTVLSRLDFSPVVVRNPSPVGDQTSSMKRALGQIEPDYSVLMQLVDHPVIDDEFIGEFISSEGDVLIPTHRGKRGHPPFYQSSFLNKIRNLDTDSGINQLYERDDVSVSEVDVDYPAVLVDLDTPDDLAAFRKTFYHQPIARPAAD